MRLRGRVPATDTTWRRSTEGPCVHIGGGNASPTPLTRRSRSALIDTVALRRPVADPRALPLGAHPEVAKGQLICAASRRPASFPDTSQPRPELADLCSAPISDSGMERGADSAAICDRP